jgi:putative transposase
MDLAVALARQEVAGRSQRAVADALGVARSQLIVRLRRGLAQRGARTNASDAELVADIRAVVDARASYGYRRVTALVNRARRRLGRAPVNHKRTYRVMRDAGLLLARYTGKPTRTHDGKVMTLKSDLRWCSDAFEIRCWSGERVQVAFALDCCDREVIGYVATTAAITGEMVRDLMAEAVEQRFGAGTTRVPHAIEWLSDNGPPYTAHETREFGRSLGLLVCTTPAYSPESNGMAEAFVKTFKRDYVYVNRLDDAPSVMRQLATWMADYSENHPHKALQMKSPREYRLFHSTG